MNNQMLTIIILMLLSSIFSFAVFGLISSKLNSEKKLRYAQIASFTFGTAIGIALGVVVFFFR